MNFISECILRSRKLDDGEERREYIALSEVKRLFEKWVEEKSKSMDDLEMNQSDDFFRGYDDAILDCKNVLEESNK